MTDENTPTTCRSDRRTDSLTECSKSEYRGWSNERLVDGYRRNSVLLREYGADERTIRTLCAIEERLRARNIDPDHIVERLDA